MTVYITYTFCSQTVDFLWDSRMEARSAAGCSGEKRTGGSRFFRLSKKPVIASQSADWRGNPFPKRMIFTF